MTALDSITAPAATTRRSTRPALGRLLVQGRRDFVSMFLIAVSILLVNAIPHSVIAVIDGRRIELSDYPLALPWMLACLILAFVSAFIGAMSCTTLFAFSGAGLKRQYLVGWIADLTTMVIGLAIWAFLSASWAVRANLDVGESGATLSFERADGWHPPSLTAIAIAAVVWMLALVVGRFIGHAARIWGAIGAIFSTLAALSVIIVLTSIVMDFSDLPLQSRFLALGFVPLVLVWPTTALAMRGPIRCIG